MPLNNDGSVANMSRMTSIGPSQKQRSQYEPINRSSTPLHRPKETVTKYDNTINPASRTSNPLGARDVSTSRAQDRSRATVLKMEVRNTIRNQAGNAGPDSQITSGGFTARVKSPERGRLITQQNPQIDSHTRFDDTTMDLGLDDDSSVQDNENQTVVFRGNEVQPLQLLEKDYEQTAFYRHPTLVSNAIELGPNWQENVLKERALQAQEQGFQVDDDELPEHYSYDIRYADEATSREHEDAVDTPSRGHIVQPARPTRMIQSKTVSFNPLDIEGGKLQREDSPELTIPRPIQVARPKPNPTHESGIDDLDVTMFSNVTGSPERSVRKPSTRTLSTRQNTNSINGKLPQVNTFETSRASGDLTSTENDKHPTQIQPSTSSPTAEAEQNGLKRRREHDIDYNPSMLKNMTYEDLRKEEFGTDPRGLMQDATFDDHGNTRTLSQRLNNLNKMSEEDQRKMFRNQNDQEWAQMGSWFIDKFQQDLKRLMDVRTERRKISMRYEDEIRRRQKDVEWCSANVEEELNGLKKGGGELIKGREASSRKGTPTKK